MANQDKTLNIEILDDIGGWGFTFNDLYNQAKGFDGDKIRVPVNSFGGQVFEALLIYNYLKGSGKEVETHIPTYAMSAGTIIASAGNKVTMSNHGYYMIHDPYAIAGGGSEDFERTADLLNKMKDDLVAIYVKKTGLEETEIRDMMAAETWLTSEEALEKGFVDELTEGAKIEANFDPKQFESFSNVPEDLKALFENPKEAQKETPQTNTFLNALATLFGKQTGEVFNEEIHLLKTDHDTAIATLTATYDNTIEELKKEATALKAAHDAEIKALNEQIETLKKTPIEPPTSFETSPANVGDSNTNHLTSFDRAVMAENQKKRN